MTFRPARPVRRDDLGAPGLARFEETWQLYAARVRGYLARRVAPGDVDDALVEVFTVAWRRISELPAGDEALWWLLRTASYTASTTNRAARRRAALADRAATHLHTGRIATAHDPFEVLLAANPTAPLVHAALDLVTPDDRELLRLRFWDELGTDAIASVLGITQAAAHKRLARARTRFAAAYEKVQHDDVRLDDVRLDDVRLDDAQSDGGQPGDARPDGVQPTSHPAIT